MKGKDDILTLQETERLCRLYMDCRLTVLEETELEYVLGHMPYRSALIDDVRRVMGFRSLNVHLAVSCSDYGRG